MRARENPYRAERIHSLEFRFSGLDWDGFRHRFHENGGRGSVLGPEGSGKTTLLLAFAERLRQEGVNVRRVAARADERSWERDLAVCGGLGPRDVLIIDGADMVGRLAWRRLRRETGKALGVLATSHRRRLLPVLYECRTSPELLRELMEELHPQAGCGQPQSVELFTRHRGNLRDALRELYDYHAGLGSGGCGGWREPDGRDGSVAG